MALIDDSPRSATVIAKTDVKLVPISRERFMFLVQNTPFFAIEVMQTLVGRLRHMDTLLTN
jgi:CRP-like cAMP-binding protein